MVASPHMTRPHGEEASARHAATQPGMAHFSGTGPVGTSCHECIWWNPAPPEPGKKVGRVRRDRDGFLKNRRYRKFPRLMQGQTGAGVPATTASCRHFGGHEDPPDNFVDPEAARAAKAAARATRRGRRKGWDPMAFHPRHLPPQPFTGMINAVDVDIERLISNIDRRKGNLDWAVDTADDMNRLRRLAAVRRILLGTERFWDTAPSSPLSIKEMIARHEAAEPPPELPYVDYRARS